MGDYFFGNKEKWQIPGQVPVWYRSYDEAKKAWNLLIEELGVPKGAIHGTFIPHRNNNHITVTVGSKEDEKRVKNFLRTHTNPDGFP